MSAHLATYLNDHLAGSTVALEMLEHLESVHRGTALEKFSAVLRADIAADRVELEELMTRLKVASRPPRRILAWLAEKCAQLKLGLDDKADGKLHLLETFEAVSLGIEGKGSLWRALAAAAVPGLSQGDYARLEARAVEQRARLEPHRLEAARAAFTEK